MLMLFVFLSGFFASLETAELRVSDLISGYPTADGRLNFTYSFPETASAAEKVEIYLELLEIATTTYAEELVLKDASTKAVELCQTSIPEYCVKPLQDKVREKLVKIQEYDNRLTANSNLCLSLRVPPPPSCETAKENILNDLAILISENEISTLTSSLNDAINCVKCYLNSCVKNKESKINGW